LQLIDFKSLFLIFSLTFFSYILILILRSDFSLNCVILSSQLNTSSKAINQALSQKQLNKQNYHFTKEGNNNG